MDESLTNSPQGLAKALAVVIAGERKEWEKERERIQADARAMVAEALAENTRVQMRCAEAIQEVRQTVDVVIKQLTDRQSEVGRDLSDCVQAASERSVETIQRLIEEGRQQIEELRSLRDNIKDGRDGVDGKDVDPVLVEKLVAGEVEKRVAMLPPPPKGDPGKDADETIVTKNVMDRLRLFSRQMVREALETLPRPEKGEKGDPGRDGKDTSPDFVKTLVDAAVVKAVADLPPPAKGEKGDPGKDGVDGKDAEVDYGLVLNYVKDEVAAEVKALPPPERGEPGLPGKDAEVDYPRIIAHVEDTIAKAIGDLPPPEKGEPGKDGADAVVDYDRINAVVTDEVTKAVSALPPAEKGDKGDKGEPGTPGKDAEEVNYEKVTSQIEELVALAVANLPPAPKGDPGDPGQDVDMEFVNSRIDEAVTNAVAMIPPAKPGKDGADGKDADEEVVVEKVLARIPAPKDGKDAEPVDYEKVLTFVKSEVATVVSELPPPERGEPGARGEKGDPGPSGVGLAGAFLDRSGALLLTLSDGTVQNLGRVEGLPGKDGKDGITFEDFVPHVEYDGERTVTLRIASNGKSVEWPIRFPFTLDRGVYSVGKKYEQGDSVSWGGSIWIAQCETTERPGDQAKDWRLAVKRGKDGKDGEPGKKGEQGPPGRPGRDFTNSGLS